MNLTRNSVLPDLVIAGPEQAKVLLENERIRVLKVRLKADQAQAMHPHPDHLIYPLSASTLLLMAARQ